MLQDKYAVFGTGYITLHHFVSHLDGCLQSFIGILREASQSTMTHDERLGKEVRGIDILLLLEHFDALHRNGGMNTIILVKIDAVNDVCIKCCFAILGGYMQNVPHLCVGNGGKQE